MHNHSTIVCKQCNTPFRVNPSRLAQANIQFCSSECRRDWNIAHKKAPIMHTCKCCGKEFTAHASAERSYCSKECYWKDKPKPKPDNTTCEVCGKPFRITPSWPARFCSRNCRDIWQRNKEERTCKQCDKTFSVHPHRKNIYCSQSCASKANNAARKVSYPIRTCAKCGKKFEHQNRSTKGKFCSRACSDATKKNQPAQEWISKPCAYCGNVFQCPPWKPKTTHCSPKCASQHRAQTVRGQNHPLWKDKIEMACEVCGKICLVQPCQVTRFRACSKRCATILSIRTQRGRVSSIEILLGEAMKIIKLYPTPQYPIGRYIADFAFVEQKLVVECDGDYWHNLPEQKVKDQRKDDYLTRHGWHIIRLSETDINFSPIGSAVRVQTKLQSLTSLPS